MESMFVHLAIGMAAVLALEPCSIFGLTLNLPTNLGYCLLGTLIGTLIGVLPGLGPVATIAMLLPATFTLPPLGGLIMIAGIYYGAQYGGSTTAILVNLPGETSSVVTCIDGYQMARKGRAGVALATCAIASFFAGCVGTALLAAFAPVLAEMAGLLRKPSKVWRWRSSSWIRSILRSARPATSRISNRVSKAP